jgi:hypothetical protein
LVRNLHGGYDDDKSLQKNTVSLPQELKEEDFFHEKAMEKARYPSLLGYEAKHLA